MRLFLPPLADRMRPQKLSDVLGQEQFFGRSSAIIKSLKEGHLPSLIFWGPPGCGKTTIARLLAAEISADFVTLEAAVSGLKEFRVAINRAVENKIYQKQTVLFIDEIHRWNKKQQDALLPYVENGTVTFIGATTENPSFEVISALLSRVKVLLFEAISKEVIVEILERASQKEKISIGRNELELIAQFSGGDARVALNALELSSHSVKGENVTKEIIKEIFDKTNLLYDKAGEEHYNIISAFIKSMRGSDANAAVYYLARMIEGGEDPEFIARRMLIFASEDIGNALPTALVVANTCFDAVRKIGWPESELILSQTAIYLAKAPKSNLAKLAIGAAREEVQKSGTLPVPLHLRNASTSLMTDLGYGKNYIYTHNNPSAPQDFLPSEIVEKKFVL